MPCCNCTHFLGALRSARKLVACGPMCRMKQPPSIDRPAGFGLVVVHPLGERVWSLPALEAHGRVSFPF